MIKFLTFLLFPELLSVKVLSQIAEEKKVFEHAIGIQANQLLRQIINLDVDNAILSNPYLLNYVLIHNQSLWGIMAGVGYDYLKTADKKTPGNHESRINDISARLGIARKFPIEKKLFIIAGLDYVPRYV